MANCNPNGFLAYDPRDLSPHGVISTTLARTHPAGTTIPERVGQTLRTQDDGTILEIRKQLPSKRLSVEFRFRKGANSNNLSLTQIGEQSGSNIGGVGLLGGGAGSLALILASSILAGGTSTSITEFVWHISESETVFNLPITLTDSNLYYDELKLPGFPVTIFGIFDKPVEFTVEQKANIGVIPGSGKPDNGIAGPQIQYDGRVKVPDGNRFVSLIRDRRKDVFRADATGGKYGFVTNPEAFNDLTDDTVKLDASGIASGNIVYFTGTIAKKRYLRQAVDHKALLIEGSSTVGITQQTVSIGDINRGIWNYAIAKWMVNCVPFSDDSAYDSRESVEKVLNGTGECLIEGWRLSEIGTKDFPSFWAADGRGIVKVTNEGSEVIFSRSLIRDKNWFDQYLLDTGRDKPGSYFENSTDNNGFNSVGNLFDLNIKTNSLLFDNQKIPYHKDLAKALSSVTTYNKDVEGTGVGIQLLDLKANGTISTLDTTDLSFAKFSPSGQTSMFPSSYSTEPCDGIEDASFSNPVEQFQTNIFNLFGAGLPPALQSDWILRTPFIDGKFGKKSRIFMERFTEKSGISGIRKHSRIYVNSIPFDESSISIDHTFLKDKSFIVFGDPQTESLSYIRSDDSMVYRKMDIVRTDLSRTHNFGEFDHDKFKIIGYPPLMEGDPISYSGGVTISGEWGEICYNNLKSSEVFTTGSFVHPAIINASITFLRVPPVVNNTVEIFLNKDKLYNEIIIEYYTAGIPIGTITEDKVISIEFEGSNQYIHNIALPTNASGVPELVNVRIDTRYSGPSTKMILRGEMLSKINIKSIKYVASDANIIRKYFVNAQFSSIFIDEQNSLYVFYGDENSGNISVAISANLGKQWIHLKDIIRLKQGETADMPYIIRDSSKDKVLLFYRLNNAFLMITRIDTNWFDCSDIGKEYVPPSDINVSSDVDLGLELYSDYGKALRKNPSLFVSGDKDDPFFVNEISITEQRIENKIQVFRFFFNGNEDDLDRAFSDASFTAFADRHNAIRLFYTLDDGRLYGKAGSISGGWSSQISEVVFHRDFVNDKDENPSTKISNIQAIYDDQSDFVYLVYVASDMLLYRKIDAELLYPRENDEIVGNMSQSVLSHLTIDNKSTNKPVFLAGTISNDMELALTNKLKSVSQVNEPLIDFYYTEKALNNFAEGKIAINTTAKPAGWITANGIARILYKSSEDFVHGISINGLTPKMDIHLVSNNEQPLVTLAGDAGISGLFGDIGQA